MMVFLLHCGTNSCFTGMSKPVRWVRMSQVVLWALKKTLLHDVFCYFFVNRRRHLKFSFQLLEGSLCIVAQIHKIWRTNKKLGAQSNYSKAVSWSPPHCTMLANTLKAKIRKMFAEGPATHKQCTARSHQY